MNVLICADDQFVRKMLEKITSKNKNINSIFTATDGIEAVKIAEKEKIDIALLDIDMPNLNGIEAAKIISKVTSETYFIFITAHMEYAIDSFCVHPYDYLLKPIDIESFEIILDELVELIQQKSAEKIKKIKVVGDRAYQIEFFESRKEASLSRKNYKRLIKDLSN